MKEKIEITFQEWEQKLSWVMGYKTLITEDNLTLEQCAQFAEMRENAVNDHKSRENLQPKTSASAVKSGEIRDPVKEKFQTAMDNLIAKFCEPVEEEYSSLVKKLTAETAQRDDYSKFSDELKTRYLEAATLRYYAKTQLVYNYKVTYFMKNNSVTPEKAEENFEQAKEGFKKRYISDILNKDRVILQNRVAELKDEEAKSLELFVKNTQTITDTELEITALSQPIQKDIATKKATLMRQEHGEQKPLIKRPPPPLFIPKPLISNNSQKSPKIASTTDTKLETSFSAKDILNVKLRNRAPVQDVPQPEAAEVSMEQSASKIFGAFLASTSQLNLTKSTIVKPVIKEKSMDDIEESLDGIALAIKQNVENVTQLKQCIDKQNAFIRVQKSQLKGLQEKNWKVEIHGEPVKIPEVLDASTPMKINTSTRPPPPPKFSPNKVLTSQAKKVEKPVIASEEKTSVESSTLATKPGYHNELFLALGKRRVSLFGVVDEKYGAVDEDDWGDDDNSVEKEDSEAKQKNKERIEAENTKKAEELEKRLAVFENTKKVDELEKRLAVLKKYDEAVQKKFNPETSGIENNQRIVAELQRLETKNTQPLIVTQLEEAIKELKSLEAKKVLEVKVAIVETAKVETVEIPPVEDVVETVEIPPVKDVVEVVDIPLVEDVAEISEQEIPLAIAPKLDTPESVFKQDFRKLCDKDPILNKRVGEKELSLDVMKDVLVLRQFVQNKLVEMSEKNIDAFDKPFYKKSLTIFYKGALDIRLSNVELPEQKKQLENLAHTTFEPRHFGRRILADVLMLITSLVGIGIVVGVSRALSGHSYFFSEAPTKRESDLKNILQDDDSNNLLFVSPPLAG